MKHFSVLISSIGRRHQLADCFRSALRTLEVEGKVFGIDSNPELAPAARLVDACFHVPPCTSPDYIEKVLSICEEHDIRLIVPTIDTELLVYANVRESMAKRGVQIAVSSPQAVQIACDKVCTHRFLVEADIPTMRQAVAAEYLSKGYDWSFPLFVKPRRGSASMGIARIDSMARLLEHVRNSPDLIVQDFAAGDEYTVNVFADRCGRCICAVPHRRIEVRGGEVSKAVTVRNDGLIAIARKVVESLPGAYGALNVQCFVDNDRILVNEINARFGGGYPLTFEAGANFPLWLLQSIVSQDVPRWFSEWTDNLTMLRFDSAVYF
jgi:carbamoyl-phosphate synthase large subunit